MVLGKNMSLAQIYEKEGGNSGVETRPVDDRISTPISKSNINFNLSPISIPSVSYDYIFFNRGSKRNSTVRSIFYKIQKQTKFR